MANLNRIILIGRLASEPEARSTTDGLPMTKIRLAVRRPSGLGFKGASSGETDFFDVIAWRDLAESCGQGLSKGQLVLVEGRIQIRSFEDQTGERRWATEVVARDVHLLEEKRGAVSKNNEDVEGSDLASDLPF